MKIKHRNKTSTAIEHSRLLISGLYQSIANYYKVEMDDMNNRQIRAIHHSESVLNKYAGRIDDPRKREIIEEFKKVLSGQLNITIFELEDKFKGKK